MTQTKSSRKPRWPAVVALIAVAGLYLALPESLTVGPSWLLPVLVGVLLIPTVVARRERQARSESNFRLPAAVRFDGGDGGVTRSAGGGASGA